MTRAELSSDVLALVGWLDRLADAYRASGYLAKPAQTTGGGVSKAARLQRLLFLSSALLRNVVLPYAEGRTRATAQVAVFGGTQVGKSTMVNVLVGQPVAQVHHTAGFTRHAHAFLPSSIPEDFLQEFPNAFPGFRQVPPAELKLTDADTYAISRLRTEARLPHVVVWDVPDCDAVDALNYQRGMTEAITLADAVVYVTSREKYAVNVVLEWVLLLLQAGTPITVCLNMTPASQQTDILKSMQEALARVAERQGTGQSPTAIPEKAVAFEYVQDGDVSVFYGSEYSASQQLRQHVLSLIHASRAQPALRPTRGMEFVAQVLPEVIAPALAEAEAAAAWERLVAKSLQQFVQDYRRTYLDDPRRYDAFNMVGVEILALLDPPIPGLQKTIAAVRMVVGLPARMLLMAGRFAWSRATTTAQSRIANAVPNEVQTFREAHGSLLNSLARSWEHERARAEHSCFWDALARRWEADLKNTHSEFESQLQAHRARTQEWIRETAQAIYGELARNPTKLNMLRTGRISADAAAIVISIKTGGAGDIVHDLVLAPALMSVIEAITQQLAESYVQGRRQELRERLLHDTQRFSEQVYGTRLRKLGTDATRDCGFADIDIAALPGMPERARELARKLRADA